MQTNSYKAGFFLGRFTRQLLRSCRRELLSSTPAKSSPQPCVDDSLSTIPAMVRKGVDLDQWRSLNIRPLSNGIMDEDFDENTSAIPAGSSVPSPSPALNEISFGPLCSLI